MISTVNPDENLMAARLLDYFSSRTPWHRTLWNAGTVLALREVLEASEAQNLGHLSEKSIRGAVTTALRLLKDDPGIGSATERTALAGALTLNGEPRDEISYKGMEYEQIEELLNRATPLYLERWAQAISSDSPPPAERGSRAIAAHLLDQGFNSNFLHRWWTYRLRIRKPADTPFSGLVSEAAALSIKPETEFTVLIPFPSELKPPRGLLPPTSWLDAARVFQSGIVVRQNVIGLAAITSRRFAPYPTRFKSDGGANMKMLHRIARVKRPELRPSFSGFLLLNLHNDEVAHTLILGMTGSGKSFLCNFLLTNAQKYKPLTYIFDSGDSFQSLTETLFGSLKVERLHGMEFKSHREAKDATLDWLLWYNGSRMHATLRYLSPTQFEQQAIASTLALAA